MSDIPSVLVLGEDTRSFLSVIRSLGKANYHVHVVCYDKTSPALKSRYIKSVQYYNYQAYSQAEWLDNVIALIERYQFDLVIPCDERALYPLWSAKDRMPQHTKLAIANPEALDALFDKWKTKQVAIECDVPVARGSLVDLYTANYNQLKGEYGEMFVVKPLQSFEESKLNQRQKVKIVHSEDEFNEYRKYIDNPQEYLIEEFFIGKGEGVSVLAIEGQVVAAFAHVRVAEPKQGGGSSYRMSIPLDSALFKATEAVCMKTRLTGVAMFEYRRNLKTNEWILVEVNARFWGSLPLAVFAGVDFPRFYADYLLRGVTIHPVLTYRDKAYARVLIADIYEIKREFEANKRDNNTLSATGRLVVRLLQIGRALLPIESIDSFERNDPKPFFAEISILMASLFASILRKNRLFLKVRRYVTRRSLKKLFKANPNRRIIFVCYGNIMRSPFAQACVDAVADQYQELSFDSFGFHLDEARQSPDKAQQAAKILNYDLSTHSSKWLTQLDIKDQDIVIYFDSKNRDKLSAYYRVNHAFSAADLVDESLIVASDIEDPYGGDLNKVTDCYRKIESSVTSLLGIFREVRG
ncbi:ATP-grasp domain-containing protein [Vibrio hannami]|uniref:arsenate reductase/protein-tyrosine-phosphatase family protein n=1 Tax=Vibrio hannami TaxID=2717094 RepID=UPI00240EA5DD|nr:ATP-grasp domain-containing protein [Vibrio hannami]MDG3088288.1 ATP-grasp domain-containing protein [Vibrio hannami]